MTVNAIEKAEVLYDKKWGTLQTMGFEMVRLNIDDEGKPCDLMFAWGSSSPTGIDGVLPYDEAFEKENNVMVRTQ